MSAGHDTPVRDARAAATPTALIGGDWGTTNLRLFRFDAHGEVLERRETALGIQSVADGEYAAALQGLIGDWLRDRPEAPVLLSGMIGSRQGWREAPYLVCPASAAEAATQLLTVCSDRGVIRIVPGLQCERADGRIDVMRGEETQIFGALAQANNARTALRLVIAPGTHSKWITVEGKRIVAFSTYMTGELFALLKTHSILGRLMQGDDHDADAFETGVRRSLADPAISRLLFSVRSEGLFARIPAHALSAYLSGLLIGAEVGAALGEQPASSAVLIGSTALAARYRSALTLAGLCEIETIDGEGAAAAGLWQLANIT
jgi:2-dehydro-3-deoxygalactonokinase